MEEKQLETLRRSYRISRDPPTPLQKEEEKFSTALVTETKPPSIERVVDVGFILVRFVSILVLYW